MIALQWPRFVYRAVRANQFVWPRSVVEQAERRIFEIGVGLMLKGRFWTELIKFYWESIGLGFEVVIKIERDVAVATVSNVRLSWWLSILERWC